MSKPIYCPNCGTKLINEHFYIKPFTAFEAKDQTGKIVVININGYGCFCEACNWEGDIFPYADDLEGETK